MQYLLEDPIQGENKAEKYQCLLRWRKGEIIADEPVSSGGNDAGPDPYTLLLSSLASCTLITLRMYIERKGWDISGFSLKVNMLQQTKDGVDSTLIDRDIEFEHPIPEEQRIRLLEIAKQCPISKILQHEIKVRTFVLNERETEKKIAYANDDITVVWQPSLCQHATRCWQQLPEVFDYTQKKWVNPDGASADAIMAQVGRCPSGALSAYYNKEK